MTPFKDSAKWTFHNNYIVYVPQDRTYKEVLLGGTPIEYFVSDQTPTRTIGTPDIKVRLPRINAEPAHTKPKVYDFQDNEDYYIVNDSWKTLTHEQLLFDYDWIRLSSQIKNAELGFNGCRGLGGPIVEITKDGGILTADSNNVRHYIKRNADYDIKVVRMDCIDNTWIETEWFGVHDVYISVGNEVVQTFWMYRHYDDWDCEYEYSWEYCGRY